MIGWRDEADALHHGTLFAAFAALARGEAWSFPALRPHQREPWHAFTVQVAAMALIRAGRDDLPTNEATWRELLVALSGGVAEAWELVLDDWSKPALLQPPVPDARRGDYKSPIVTPDALDILVTSKNHELKQERMRQANAEDWLFSLVTLQTAAAYGGAKTYGASRMNGKTGSRLIARVRPPGGSGAAFGRDVTLLAEAARSERDLPALIWLEPNDGEVPISYATLAPSLYIDCARRIRLCGSEGAIAARYATAEKPRINADAAAGVTGDPYAPIKPDATASVTPKRETFGYRGLAKLLKAPAPLLARVHPTDQVEGTEISFSAIVRRGGTDTNTDGFFNRPIRTSWVDENEDTGDVLVADRIGDAAIARAKEAGDASRRLRHALIILMSGGRDRDDLVRARDGDAEEWTASLRRFDLDVDRAFFGKAFWAEVARPADPKHRRDWRLRLRKIAEQTLVEAIEAAPRTTMRRDEAAARAENRLGWDMDQWLNEVPGVD